MSFSTGSEASGEVSRVRILELMTSRGIIDEEIAALGGILASNQIGMTEPLTDADGYPRNDIDIYQVRHARHRIICLQNDRKNLTKEIERRLVLLHEESKESGMRLEDMDTEMTQRDYQFTLSPIARVNLVSEGSPAFQAGVRVDDEIVAVGSINSRNFTTLTDIGNLVLQSKGTVVNIVVRRNGGQEVKLALIPGPWAGKGLIGCNILRMEDLIDR